MPVHAQHTFINTVYIIKTSLSTLSTHVYQLFLTLHVFPRVDSVMLLEAGFTVKSVDASDKMLKYAYKLRWQRHKDNPVYDDWGRSEQLGHQLGD